MSTNIPVNSTWRSICVLFYGFESPCGWGCVSYIFLVSLYSVVRWSYKTYFISTFWHYDAIPRADKEVKEQFSFVHDRVSVPAHGASWQSRASWRGGGGPNRPFKATSSMPQSPSFPHVWPPDHFTTAHRLTKSSTDGFQGGIQDPSEVLPRKAVLRETSSVHWKALCTNMWVMPYSRRWLMGALVECWLKKGKIACWLCTINDMYWVSSKVQPVDMDGVTLSLGNCKSV